jgi:hypothetical protein
MSRNVGKQLPAYAAQTTEKIKDLKAIGDLCLQKKTMKKIVGGKNLSNLLHQNALSFIHKIHE